MWNWIANLVVMQFYRPHHEYGQFAPYVDEYMNYAREYGVVKGARIDQLDKIYFADLVKTPGRISADTDVIAQCETKRVLFLPGFFRTVNTRIQVDPTYHKIFAGTVTEKWMMMHELAHCVHGAPHSSDADDLMTEVVPERSDDELEIVYKEAIHKFFTRLAEE